jgi:hypothetical protein
MLASVLFIGASADCESGVSLRKVGGAVVMSLPNS